MKKIIASCSLCFFQLSHADLPLTVENLISDKGKVTTEFGLTYGNNKINNTKVGGYIPVQISDSSFIAAAWKLNGASANFGLGSYRNYRGW